MRKHPQDQTAPQPKGLRILAILGGSLALALGGVLAVASSGSDVPLRRTISFEPLQDAKIAFADRDFGRAESLTREALRTAPDSRDAKLLLGRILLERGRIAEARGLFAGLLKAQAEDVDGLCGMGEALRRMGQGDLAITHFQRAARLRGNDPYVWKQLGMAQREKGDAIGALASFQKSLSVDGKQEDLLNLVSELAVAKQDLQGLVPGIPKNHGLDPKTIMPTLPRPHVPDPKKPYWKNQGLTQ